MRRVKLMSDKAVVFILGKGRSGTSALTRVLSLCGCALPQSLLGATDLNPTGFWEPADAIRLNVDLLERLGISLNELSMRFAELSIGDRQRDELIGRIQDFLAACPQDPMLVIKAGGTEIMELWYEAAARAGFSARAVIAVRHPQEVFASTAKIMSQQQSPESENGPALTIEKFNAAWLRENLLAERVTRAVPRVVVEYANLLQDWRAEVGRVSNALSIDLRPDESAIDSFLTPNLYRHKWLGPITETFGYSWTTRVYSILSSAAHDQPMDIPSMNEIYHGYAACARAFRNATNESHSARQVREYLDRQPVWRAGQEF